MFETTNQKYIYIYPLIILHFFEEFLGLSMAKRLAAAFLDKRLPTHYVDYWTIANSEGGWNMYRMGPPSDVNVGL